MDAVISFIQAWWWAGALVVFGIYLLNGINVVNQWERKPLKRFGRFVGTLGPGIHWREPFSTRVISTIDIRDQVDSVYSRLGYKTTPPMQTHDNVPIGFILYVTYRIREQEAANFSLNVEDAYNAVWMKSAALVAEQVSSTELDTILHDRRPLYRSIVSSLQEAVSTWGVQIIAIEMQDVSITDSSIQEAIAMKARAKKEAEAELVRAQAQEEIAKQLSAAGDAFDEGAWRLKGLETLLELCRSAENNTIIVPTDMIEGLARIAGSVRKSV
jgi:regulator of protease activity HflC (stomatin/prohibitin superfamily)